MKIKTLSFVLALLTVTLCNSCAKPLSQDIYINPYESGYSSLKTDENKQIKIFKKENNDDKEAKGMFKIEVVEIDDSKLITPILNDYVSSLNYDFLSFENRTANNLIMTYTAEISTDQGNIYYSLNRENFALYLSSDKGLMSRTDQEFKDQFSKIKTAFDSKETKTTFFTDSFRFDEEFFS